MEIEKTRGAERVLIGKDELRNRIEILGQQISEDYTGRHPVLISVLRGGLYFLADLSRAITIPVHIDFLSIGRYSEEQNHTGVVRITKDLDISITGRHVLIVEDIIDTGLTLGYLTRTLQAHNPESLSICTLLNNPARRLINLPLDYIGFDIPDVFVVGYGLDYKEDYRHLSYIAVYTT